MDEVLNVGFFVLHTSWILFNCAGWAWRRTRRWHLATIAATAVSWFVLGARYGWGYCPCTDWHWRVRERLGYADPPSYIQLFISVVTGIELRQPVADRLAVGTLTAAAALSMYFNFVHERKRRAMG